MEKISLATVGRFGEHMVQAELERVGWNTSNLNAGHPNAPSYDILAWRAGVVETDSQSATLPAASVFIRVKASRPMKKRRFLFSVDKEKPPSDAGIQSNDFTVFVGMGNSREEDEFYVIPTREVRKKLRDRWNYYHKMGGGGWGMLALNFHNLKQQVPGNGLDKEWACYRKNWEALG